MSLEKVLIIDDDKEVGAFVQETLSRLHLDVTVAKDGTQGLRFLQETPFDLVITDMKMPRLTGIDVIKKIKEIAPQTLVLVVTAYGSIENAVEAMQLGAFHYLVKPFSPDMLEVIIGKAKEHLSLVQENQFLKSSPYTVIGESPLLKKILTDMQKIAQSNASVFISGESGVGKEVIAQAIHYSSPRASKPFIQVNCAAVAETLIESEFFGHEKGSFTGATSRRLGRFELAHQGSLLLDEISEIPLPIQAKLLRVIQEHQFERVGGTKPIHTDARLISTSNRNMQELIQQKIMREDLFYRLNVIPIYIPPLRERREDILPLSRHFLQKFCQENHRKPKTLSKQAEQKLLSYPWPGNVRELANLIERAVVTMDETPILSPDHLYLESLAPPIPLKEIEKTLKSYEG